MSDGYGKIRRWVVYDSPNSGLNVCRVDVLVDWVHSLQQQEKDTDEGVGRYLRKFPIISMHATRKEADAMVKLAKE